MPFPIPVLLEAVSDNLYFSLQHNFCSSNSSNSNKSLANNLSGLWDIRQKLSTVHLFFFSVKMYIIPSCMPSILETIICHCFIMKQWGAVSEVGLLVKTQNKDNQHFYYFHSYFFFTVTENDTKDFEKNNFHVEGKNNLGECSYISCSFTLFPCCKNRPLIYPVKHIVSLWNICPLSLLLRWTLETSPCAHIM